MIYKKRVLWSFLALSFGLFVAGCDEGSTEKTENCKVDLCVGDELQRCVDGVLQAAAACPGEQVCQVKDELAQCVEPLAVCKVDLCVGDELQRCVDGVLQAAAACPGEQVCQVKDELAQCVEPTPLEDCIMRNGTLVDIYHVVDADTLWVTAIGRDGEQCKPKNYNVRLHGLAAPECKKSKSTDPEKADKGLYECIEDTNYGKNNEKGGYEAYLKLLALLGDGKNLLTSCELEAGVTDQDSPCYRDTTSAKRTLAYFELSDENAKAYDLAEALIAAGHGLAYTAWMTIKMADYCRAEYEAQNAALGMWAAGGVDVVMVSPDRSDDTLWWYLDGYPAAADNPPTMNAKKHDDVCKDAGVDKDAM